MSCLSRSHPYPSLIRAFGIRDGKSERYHEYHRFNGGHHAGKRGSVRDLHLRMRILLTNSIRSSSRDRRSAVRARKSLSSKTCPSAVADTLEQIDKTIQLIKRHRKQRHVKLRDLTRDEDQGGKNWASVDADQMVCPVCSQTVRGDQDVMETHVDTCLAHQTSRAQEENEGASQEDTLEDVEVDGETRVRMTDSVNFRGECPLIKQTDSS
jgi:hypothetical protein